MKKYFTVALVALLAAFALSAENVSLETVKGWVRDDANTFSVDFDGSRSWPALSGQLPEMPENTYVKLTWECRIESGEPQVVLLFNDIHSSIYPGKEYARFTMYTCLQEKTAPTFRFTINPGNAGRVLVRNVAFEKLSAEDLAENLLPDNDFEAENTFPSFFHAGNSPTCLSLVPSPNFICGETSMKIQVDDQATVRVNSYVLPAVPGKTAVFTFYAKADAEILCPVSLNTGAIAGKKHLYLNKSLRMTPEWKKYMVEFKLPTDAELYPALKRGTLFLVLHLTKNAKATAVYLDNLDYRIK